MVCEKSITKVLFLSGHDRDKYTISEMDKTAQGSVQDSEISRVLPI